MNPIELTLRVTVDETNIRAIVNVIRQAVQGGNELDSRAEVKMRSSLNAPLAGKKLPENHGQLIDIHQVAKMLKVSPRTINKMERVGEMPKAIRINRVVRWGFEEISSWIASGCPSAEEWKSK